MAPKRLFDGDEIRIEAKARVDRALVDVRIGVDQGFLAVAEIGGTRSWGPFPLERVQMRSIEPRGTYALDLPGGEVLRVRPADRELLESALEKVVDAKIAGVEPGTASAPLVGTEVRWLRLVALGWRLPLGAFFYVVFVSAAATVIGVYSRTKAIDVEALISAGVGLLLGRTLWLGSDGRRVARTEYEASWGQLPFWLVPSLAAVLLLLIMLTAVFASIAFG